MNEKGQTYSDCLFENFQVWMQENNIVTSTGYQEGFHREDFEDEQEPILAARSTTTRWVPILFAFSDPNKPIIVERVDLWDKEWQDRLNYRPHRYKYREFPVFNPN